MIGLDLDGTLLNTKKELTENTRRVLREAIDAGILVLMATGRPYTGIPAELRNFPGIHYALTSNGARVLDTDHNKLLIEQLLPMESAKKALRIFEKYDTLSEIYFDGQGYADAAKLDNVGKYQWYKLNSAWRGANKFYEYWNNNKGSGSTKGLKASKSIFKDIRLADLIEKKPENAVTHTVIVTGYKVDSWGFNDPWKYKYDVLICQHSDDKKSGMLKDYPLSAKKWSTKETIYVKISGSYK